MELTDIFNIEYWEQFWNNLKKSFKAGNEKIGNIAKEVENGIKESIDTVYDGMMPIVEPMLKDSLETGVEIFTGQDIDTMQKETNTQQEPTLGIEDTTNENIESSINGASAMNWQNYLTKEQERQWEREDAIRKETQEREDSAIQRQVADAWKAGINPNLMNITGAESGGGISQATGKDYTPYTQEIQKYLKELEIELSQAFEGNENTKDRLTDLISKAIQSIATYYILKK